jgi:hypothetical protein
MPACGWPDEVEEVLRGEHAVMLGYLTPARGVVLTPVTNFAQQDREAGTVTISTSVGAWKKLERIRKRPEVALAFHTRAHAGHARPEYVLVQGRATVGPVVEDYPGQVVDKWERIEPWASRSRAARWWLRVYARRAEVVIAVDRVTVWPDLACAGTPTVHGAPRPTEPPPSQKPPRGGTGPRTSPRRLALDARMVPDTLLGWQDADGLPMIVPVRVAAFDRRRGVRLQAAAPGLLPPGARRAGLTSHWFSRGVVGQRQVVHTGWLDHATYAPHTRAAYAMPPSRLVYTLAAGARTRRRARRRRTVS